MKYYKRLNQYKASNLVYDIDSGIATSYEWYWIAANLNGVTVVNRYNYSPTTSRHVSKLMRLLDDLKITYIEIKAPRGLQDLQNSIEFYEKTIIELTERINNPRTRAHVNRYRNYQRKQCQEKILVIKALTQSEVRV